MNNPIVAGERRQTKLMWQEETYFFVYLLGINWTTQDQAPTSTEQRQRSGSRLEILIFQGFFINIYTVHIYCTYYILYILFGVLKSRIDSEEHCAALCYYFLYKSFKKYNGKYWDGERI